MHNNKHFPIDSRDQSNYPSTSGWFQRPQYIPEYMSDNHWNYQQMQNPMQTHIYPNRPQQRPPQNNQHSNYTYNSIITPHQQDNWGKRSFSQVEGSPSTSASRNMGETSPSPKRQQQQKTYGSREFVSRNFSKNLIEKSSFRRPQGNQPKDHSAEQRTDRPENRPPEVSINQPLVNNQQKLEQKKRIEQPAMMIKNAKDREWAETFDFAMKLLPDCKVGDEVNVLLVNLQPRRAAWDQIKHEIYNDMEMLLKPLGVEKILVFGSTLTGLDFCGSDLDYHIQLKNPARNMDEARTAINKASKLTRYSDGQNFKVIYTISHARVPIVRLIHLNTNVTCDVNFTSPFGYYNSYFIGHVLGYDPRIKGLAVILKLWSKSCKIAEKMIMSNYCLINLLIFYLQNLPVPMLDSIKNNQQSRTPMIVDQTFKWNFYFNDQINRSKKNNQTLRELLVGFFEFYNMFNNITNRDIVSVYTGELIPRKDFESHIDFDRYRSVVAESGLPPLRTDHVNTFIIQDPFEQNLNIGIKIEKHTDEFFEIVKSAYEKCLEMNDQPFSTLLLKLFIDVKKVGDKQMEKKMQKALKKFTMKIHSVAGDLKFCQDILRVQDKDKICSVEEQHVFYFNHTFECTKKFLEEMYLCSVGKEASDTETDPFTKVFKVILYVDTINGRKKMSFKDEATVKSEIELSKKMMDKKVRLDLDIVVKISSKDKGKTIEIDMHDSVVQKKSALLSFSNFFAVNITTALKYYLKKQWEETTAA